MAGKYIASQLEEGVFDALSRYATISGMHPSDLVSHFVEDALSGLGETTNDPYLSTFAALQASRRRERIRAMLIQLAAEALERDDTHLMEQMEKLCEANEVASGEIVARARSVRVPTGIQYDDGRGLATITIWLQEVLADGKKVPVGEVERMAREQGFKMYLLSAAKRAAGVQSRRESTCFVWYIPEANGQELLQ